ncbi:MAG: hypothetical protein IJ391_08480 [Clostridia bacterium]|nr:hypothetical protein [Clostridia bacterium]
MNEYANYFEYCVEAKNEGKLKLKRTLLILVYILFPIVFFSVLCMLKLYVLGCFIVLFTAIIWFFTWRYVQIEYEYTIVKGEMTFTKIYGRKSRREFLKTRIQDMSLIAPYKDEYKARADAAQEKYYAVSSMSSPDVYFGIFKDEKTKKSAVVFFEATEKIVRISKFYNSSATVEYSGLRY